MSYLLLDNRLLVLLDAGEDDRGMIVQSDLRSHRDFTVPANSYDPENPPDPLPADTDYNHVVFVKEMATEIEIDGVSYRGMHKNAVVAIIK